MDEVTGHVQFRLLLRLESKHFYYGIPSKPRLVARSSPDVGLQSTGPEVYLLPKESSPIRLHPLREIWEATVGSNMVGYLNSKEVKWTSLDPIRMGYASEPSPPAIIWIGVVPGSLTAEKGIEVAIHCRSILSAHEIDVHVEIRESMDIRSACPNAYNVTTESREPLPLPTVSPSALKLPHPSRELADSSSPKLSSRAISTSSQPDTLSSTLIRNPTSSTSTATPFSAARTSCCLATPLHVY